MLSQIGIVSPRDLRLLVVDFCQLFIVNLEKRDCIVCVEFFTSIYTVIVATTIGASFVTVFETWTRFLTGHIVAVAGRDAGTILATVDNALKVRLLAITLADTSN